MKITNSELMALAALVKRSQNPVNNWENKNIELESIERKSEKEFDVCYSGTYQFGTDPEDRCQFAACIKLATIAATNWVRYASLSDYPEMVEGGDWSGIRDSSKEAVDKMFAIARMSVGF